MPVNRKRLVVLSRQFLLIGVALAVTVPAAGVATLDIVSPGGAGGGDESTTAHGADAGAAGLSLVAAAPVDPVVREVPIRGVARTTARALRSRSGSGASTARRAAGEEPAALTAPEPVDGYATVGVTWKPGAVAHEDDITVSVRSFDDGTWSPWEEMSFDADHGPDPGSPEAQNARPGTEPLIVGDVEDVQVKAVTDTGRVPADMRLALVDPGEPATTTRAKPAIDTGELASADLLDRRAATEEEEPDTVATSAAGDTGVLAGAPARVTPKPQIYSRAQWGADERLRDGSPRYYEVHAGFVHHTVNANDYTRADVPSMLRGIYAYHTQARGWSDIGYNFIVDRFGRIWEGRAGGVDRPVVGAHTLGYNDYSFAMSALGNFEEVRPSRAMIRAYGRLFAWKLSLHGVDASSDHQWVGSRYFKAINGHRDAGQTACPGRYLYAKIGRIRRLAAANQVGFEPRGKSNNISGSHWPDLVVRDKKSHRVFVVRTGGQLDFQSRRLAAPRFGRMDLIAPVRDLTGDGINDIVARARRSKAGGIFAGNGRGRYGPMDPAAPRQLAGADLITGALDMDGDDKADVIVRNAKSQRLVLLRGRGNGSFRRAVRLGGDWSGYNAIFGAGDIDGDGRNDLLARGKQGRLWLVPGGRGRRLEPRRLLPGRWGGYDLMSGTGDVTGDGRPDMVVRARRSKLVFIYPGNGHGGFKHRYGPYRGYGHVNFLAIAGQVSGSGASDLVARRYGRLVTYPGNGLRNVARIVRTDAVVKNADLLLNVGDWNGDGRGDIMSRTPRTGVMYFRAGEGGNHFGPAKRAGSHWGNRRLVSAVGDMTGDGYPDLLGQPRGGAMRIYPGNGRHRFRPSYVAHSAIGGNTQLGVGLWTGDGAPDSVLRTWGGKLLLYPGNGPGGLTNPEEVGSGAKRYDWLHGVGDANGDGYPDVIARGRGTGDLWLIPGTSSGFGGRRFIADGFGRFDLSG